MTEYFLINRTAILKSSYDDNFDLNEDEMLEPSCELKKILETKAGIVWEDGYGYGYYENEGGVPVLKNLSFINRALCSLRECDNFFALSKIYINMVNNQQGREYIREICCRRVYVSHSCSFDCEFIKKIGGGNSTAVKKMFSKNKIPIGKKERDLVSLSPTIEVINDKFIRMHGMMYVFSEYFNFDHIIDKWIGMNVLPAADFRKFPFLEGSLMFMGKGYVKFCNYAVQDCEFNEKGEMRIKKLYCDESVVFMYKMQPKI